MGLSVGNVIRAIQRICELQEKLTKASVSVSCLSQDTIEAVNTAVAGHRDDDYLEETSELNALYQKVSKHDRYVMRIHYYHIVFKYKEMKFIVLVCKDNSVLLATGECSRYSNRVLHKNIAEEYARGLKLIQSEKEIIGVRGG